MHMENRADTLQGINKPLSYLKYELKTEVCSDNKGNNFIRYSLFNDSGKSITELSKIQINYFECEGEFR